MVVSSQATTAQSVRPIAPGDSAAGAVPGDVVAGDLYSEPLDADSPAPLGEQMPGEHYDLSVLSGYDAPGPSTDDFPAPVGLEAGLAAAPPPTRGTLLGQVAANFDVLDRALESALDEIENMGGDLAVWLDESDNTAWAAAGAVVLARRRFLLAAAACRAADRRATRKSCRVGSLRICTIRRGGHDAQRHRSVARKAERRRRRGGGADVSDLRALPADGHSAANLGKLRPKFDSTDIVQSVWADVVDGLRQSKWTFANMDQLRAFLVKMTRNRFVDRLRQHRRALRARMDHADP